LYADRLQQEALQALKDGDFAGAQLLGERALVAYQAAVVEARTVRADEARIKDEAAVEEARKQAAALDAELQLTGADIAALEKRLEALNAVEPVASSGKAQGEREAARQEAVKSFRLQARLLCTAARLLAKQNETKSGFTVPEQLARAEADLAELDKLAAQASAAPIDNAQRARSSCLSALTMVRRALDDEKSAAPGKADALLSELSSAGFEGARDDRGVVVTLRELFEGEKLATGAAARIDQLAALAKGHGAPLLVVVHAQSAAAADVERDTARGVALAAALAKTVGDKGVGAPEIAGTFAPLVDPNGKHRVRNERVEVVFVTMQAL
jgi:hypothetical protein